ncbi:MAG TPA: hypothetical protein VGG32_11155 [Thermoplasmata archaeon]
MSKECPHRNLVARLQAQKKFGEQKGYCSQQCKGWVEVFVPEPKPVGAAER